MKKIFPFLLIAGIGASAVAPSFLRKDVVSVSASNGLPDYMDNFTYGTDYVLLSNLSFSIKKIRFDKGSPQNRYAEFEFSGMASGADLVSLGFGFASAGFINNRNFTYTNFGVNHFSNLGSSFSTMRIVVTNLSTGNEVSSLAEYSKIGGSSAFYVDGLPYMINGGFDEHSNDERPYLEYSTLDNVHNSWFSFGFYTSHLTSDFSYSIYLAVSNDIYWDGNYDAVLSGAWIGTYQVALAQISSGAVSVGGSYGTGYNNGYNDGYDDGFLQNNDNAYNDGYNIGKATGEQLGYADGYNDGLEYITDGSMFSWITAMFVGISGIFNVVIFKDFTIGAIALIVIVFTLVPFVIGLFKSGGKK